MKRFRSLIMAALLCAAIPTSAQTLTETSVSMSDAVTLDAFVCTPGSPAPSGGYPAVLFVHGFGGSKNDVRSLALIYAADGYVTVGYSVRGQGRSGGVFDFFNSERLLGDLRAMIDYTATQPQVNASRVAVVGGSQGGLHAWFAAAYDMPVRTVVSFISNGRFADNWLENNALNFVFSYAGQSTGINLDPALKDMLNQARTSGKYDDVRSFLTQYSTTALETEIKIPVAIMVAGHDIFFNQNAAIRQFSNLGEPSRFILYPGEHDLPTDKAQNNYVMDVTRRWLAWWLKDDAAVASVASPDSAVVHFDGATGERRVFRLADEGLWLAPDVSRPEVEELRLYFTNRGLMPDIPVNQGYSNLRFVPFMGSQPAVFRSDPQTRDVTIAPFSGLVTMYASATGASYQVNVQLFDLDPLGGRRPIGRGHMQVDGNTGGTQLLQFELTRMLNTLRAGHVLEAQVHGGIALIPDLSVNFGNIVLAPTMTSDITLWWGGDVASMLRLYTIEAAPVSVGADPPVTGFALSANYPNPFSATTYLPVQLSSAQHVRVRVYSAAGREVALLHDGIMEPGRHVLRFDAGTLPSGMYFCRLESVSGVVQRQVLILR
jgi:predicted acyl esterase